MDIRWSFSFSIKEVFSIIPLYTIKIKKIGQKNIFQRTFFLFIFLIFKDLNEILNLNNSSKSCKNGYKLLFLS